MMKRLLIILVLAAVVAAVLWWRRPRAEALPAGKPAADAVLPDRKAFDAWQGSVKLDNRTDYGKPEQPKAKPAGH